MYIYIYIYICIYIYIYVYMYTYIYILESSGRASRGLDSFWVKDLGPNLFTGTSSGSTHIQTHTTF